MTKKLIPIPSDRLVEYVPLINKYVKPAFETGIGEKTYEQLIGLAMLGQVTVWAAFNDDALVGMATTEITDFPAYRSVHIITAGTDLDAGFGEFHLFLQDYAASIGARNLQFWGRKGWTRAIDKIPGRNGEQYKEVYRVFSMEIENVNNKNDYDANDEASK